MKYTYSKIKTNRLETAYIKAGKEGNPKLVLLHGNFSSCVFYSKLMEKLEDKYEIVAPDFRCFGNSSALPVDGRRGLRDFSDDLDEFVTAIGWDHFALLGWSMGGGVAMQYVIDHCDKVDKLILQAPLSPYGYGGTYDVDGKKIEPAGLGSGACCANFKFCDAIVNIDRNFIKQGIELSYVSRNFKMEENFLEELIDAILLCKIGPEMCQGGFIKAEKWPFISAGEMGVSNTMANIYCDLTPIVNLSKKPPILWIRGDEDITVSDTCLGELAMLAKLGLCPIPGYPGDKEYPNQPMVSQTRYVFDKYKDNGGEYKEVVVKGSGHGPMLDNEEIFINELVNFL